MKRGAVKLQLNIFHFLSYFFFFCVFHHTSKQVKEVVYLLERNVRGAVKDCVVFCSSSSVFTLAVLS